MTDTDRIAALEARLDVQAAALTQLHCEIEALRSGLVRPDEERLRQLTADLASLMRRGALRL